MVGSDYDMRFMAEALALAKKGWGKVAVNPLVGAVVVKNNRIVGRGFHRRIGEAHAEVTALLEAGRRAEGGVLYVNLEPCPCTGRTPPCVEAILKAKIGRVVVGMYDPNPQVNKNGIKFLLDHRISVSVGILERESRELNRFYTKYITKKIPYIVLKIAVSRDGRISGYVPKYITSEKSRRFVHSLRSQVDAVLVGINTVIADNPYLTDRLVSRSSPTRVVIDPHLRIPMTASVLRGDARCIIVTSEIENQKKIRSLQNAGVEIVSMTGDYYPLNTILEILSGLGIGSIMVEGGGIVFTQFLGRKMYDELYVFVAPQTVATGSDFLKENSIDLNSMQMFTLGEDKLYVHGNN